MVGTLFADGGVAG